MSRTCSKSSRCVFNSRLPLPPSSRFRFSGMKSISRPYLCQQYPHPHSPDVLAFGSCACRPRCSLLQVMIDTATASSMQMLNSRPALISSIIIEKPDNENDLFQAVGDLAKSLGHRLTTHPGQFTQIGSPTQKVVDASVRELEYHCDMMDRMGLGPDAVMIIHMGVRNIWESNLGGDTEICNLRHRVSTATSRPL